MPMETRIAQQPLFNGVDGLFPTCIGQISLREIRPMDSQEVTHVPLETIETCAYPNSTCTRCSRMGILCHGHFQARSMGNASKHKQRPSDFLLGSERAEKFTFSIFGALLTFWNRRSRSSYSILADAASKMLYNYDHFFSVA